MEANEKFKNTLVELRRHEAALKRQAREYEALQREIEHLRRRAGHDADARKRLQRLDEFMRSGGSQLQQQIAKRAEKLEAFCKRVEKEVYELSPSHGGRHSKAEPSSKNSGRQMAVRAFINQR